MQDTRQVLVPSQRLSGWVERFGKRNGTFAVESRGVVVVLSAVNGCRAELTPPMPVGPGVASPVEGPSPTLEDALKGLIQASERPVTIGMLLLRRGGYAVGVARGGKLLASKTGTRYVQSRTAAGGWSQQRFARRRANQADALVETAAQRAEALFAQQSLDCLQPGGDAQLLSECFDHNRLSRYSDLPVLPLLAVPDPRLDVLRKAASDAMAVRVRLTGIPED